MSEQASDEQLEVYEHEAGGWAVRRPGEAQALSHHDDRQEAERAAGLHSADGRGIDIRQDIFSDDPEQAVGARHTAVAVAVAALAVLLLLVVLSLIVAAG